MERLTVVVPVRNEESVLPALWSRLAPVLDALPLAAVTADTGRAGCPPDPHFSYASVRGF